MNGIFQIPPPPRGPDGGELTLLAELYDSGALRPVLDRTFPFEQTLDAMAYVEEGKANGKIVVVR